MIIGIDASRAASERRTGTEGYAWHLITALLPLAAARGHHVRLYFNQTPAVPFDSGAHEAVVIPLARLWTHVRLAAELHRRPPDVFFTPAHVIPYSYRGASVATIHDLGYLHFPQAHPAAQRRYLDWSTRHNARRARRVLADSDATRADLSAFYATPRAKVSVVYPGRDVALRRVQDAAALAAVRQRHAIDAPYWLYLGTLQPRKNLARIVQAFGLIGDRLPHTLVLAGRAGWLAQSFDEAINTLPPTLRARVRQTGYVADDDKAALLSGAAALVFPSLYEGFGFPILEAQACGTAVLTARNSSLPEVAGKAAHYVDAESARDIADGLLRLAADPAYRADLIARGLTNVTRFDWQRTAAQALDVLEQAANA